MKRNQAAMRRALIDQSCRVCGTTQNLHPHHVVYRSLVQCDEPLNLVALCFRCHAAVHGREYALGVHLTLPEQAHAVSLIGLGQAFDLLMPSINRTKRAAPNTQTEAA